MAFKIKFEGIELGVHKYTCVLQWTSFPCLSHSIWFHSLLILSFGVLLIVGKAQVETERLEKLFLLHASHASQTFSELYNNPKEPTHKIDTKREAVSCIPLVRKSLYLVPFLFHFSVAYWLNNSHKFLVQISNPQPINRCSPEPFVGHQQLRL